MATDWPLERTIPRKNRRPPNPRVEAAEVRLVRVLGAAMERASWNTCRLTGAWLGLAFFGGVPRRRRIAIGNARLAFPHLSESAARRIARRSAQNFAMTFCEFLHLHAATPAEVREYTHMDGLELIEDGFKRGHGVLILTAHLGNWELMGARAAQEFPLTVVARPSSNSGLEQHIAAVRRSAGIRVISKFDTARASLRVLRDNGALGILPDQHAGPDGVLLPLFGHPTRFVTSVARLALLSQAPMIPAFGVRQSPWIKDGRIIARASPGMYVSAEEGMSREETVERGTRLVSEQIEKIVRQNPEQWLWMHRRWRAEDVMPIAEVPCSTSTS